MIDKITTAVAGLFGLMFVVFGLNFFFHFIPIPPQPEGTPAAAFMGVLFTTGFLTFVKVLEIIGGILVAVPRTRVLGLLVLGPIVVNILAYTVFIARAGLEPPVILMTVFALYLLWAERNAFIGLLKNQASSPQSI